MLTSNQIFWCFLVGVLSIATFGLGNLFKLFIIIVLSVVAFLAGGLLFIYIWCEPITQELKVDIHMSRLAMNASGIKSFVDSVNESKNARRLDNRLTGSTIIDEPLQEIISYVFRDFVYSWYKKVSSNQDFPLELKLSAQKVVSSFANQVKDVDWIPYLTTRLVDDVASHLRLYKKATQKLKEKNKVDNSKLVDLESLFFDGEVAMEETVCRDHLCTSEQAELEYLRDLSEVLLYLLLPSEDFHNVLLRYFVREVIVSKVFHPLMTQVSDPDWINEKIVYFYKDYTITPEIFIQTLRCTENTEELHATREILSKEIAIARSNDAGGANENLAKQQLNSLLYLRKIIDNRVHRLQNGSENDSIGIPSQIDWNNLAASKQKLFNLPLEVLLKNNIALSYFIDYMTSIGSQAYLFFYLNIEGWKVSAEQQIQALDLEKLHTIEINDSKVIDQNHSQILENMREAAHSIYEQYLSEKANPRLKLDDSVVKRLLFRIRTEPPEPEWFDEIQDVVYEKFTTEERFLNTFKKSVGYVKLLAELDLLKDNSNDEDEFQIGTDDGSLYENISLNSYDIANVEDGSLDMNLEDSSNVKKLPDTLSVDSLPKSKDAHGPIRKNRSNQNLTEADRDKSRRMSPSSISLGHRRVGSSGSYRGHSRQGSYSSQSDLPPVISAEIFETAILKDGVKQYAVYAIKVNRRDPQGNEEKWHVYRRYSDFFALHEKIGSKYPTLAKLPFPGKKTWGNMDKAVLEKRRNMLNAYLSEVLDESRLQEYTELLSMILKFLEQASYEEERSQTTGVAKAFGQTVVNPLKNSVKSMSSAVTSMPGHLIDNVMDGLNKAFQTKDGTTDLLYSMKVGASLDIDTDDNIPLRIMLLFMDEVFELKERNQWLRRQIVAVLRQIIKAMFGDIVNRRIVEFVSETTSPQSITGYLNNFKETFWPEGCLADARPPRDENTKLRTRVAAKASLLSSLSDDLKRIIGSETSRKGILSVFEMLQHTILNKRLSYVLLEGIIETLFPNHDFSMIFKNLHSRSGRIRQDLANSARKPMDLRR